MASLAASMSSFASAAEIDWSPVFFDSITACGTSTGFLGISRSLAGSGLFVALDGAVARAAFGTGEPKLMSSGFFTETFGLSSDCTAITSSFFADGADFASALNTSLGFGLGVDARWPMGKTGTAGVTGPGVAMVVFCEIGGIGPSCVSAGDGCE